MQQQAFEQWDVRQHCNTSWVQDHCMCQNLRSSVQGILHTVKAASHGHLLYQEQQRQWQQPCAARSPVVVLLLLLPLLLLEMHTAASSNSHAQDSHLVLAELHTHWDADTNAKHNPEITPSYGPHKQVHGHGCMTIVSLLVRHNARVHCYSQSMHNHDQLRTSVRYSR
jgi:hypothetical protein